LQTTFTLKKAQQRIKLIALHAQNMRKSSQKRKLRKFYLRWKFWNFLCLFGTNKNYTIPADSIVTKPTQIKITKQLF